MGFIPTTYPANGLQTPLLYILRSIMCSRSLPVWKYKLPTITLATTPPCLQLGLSTTQMRPLVRYFLFRHEPNNVVGTRLSDYRLNPTINHLSCILLPLAVPPYCYLPLPDCAACSPSIITNENSNTRQPSLTTPRSISPEHHQHRTT